MGDKVMIIEFNETGEFIRQPDIGSITGTTEVSVVWDDAWTGNENCLRLRDGVVVFDLNANYLNNRIEAYALLNQDEMRFDDLINNTTTWQDAILAIKAKFPKETI